MITDATRIIDVAKPLGAEAYLPVSSIDYTSEGYRCDASSTCYTWARLSIIFRDEDGNMLRRRFCTLHAAWRLGVKP